MAITYEVPESMEDVVSRDFSADELVKAIERGDVTNTNEEGEIVFKDNF